MTDMNEPDYRAFARDMMKLCKKYGIKMSAYNEGLVLLGPAAGKTLGEAHYSDFKFTPTEAIIGMEYDAHPIKMTRE